ncbi:hypothetical protein HK099_005619 [Clydaea vesicula]|uniref:UDENN domain-containing protein n=1 Tax=Clydaea vesicula TaxID=447962 RepID=A0AAD5XZH5_9FUNG|nr:hypothetical protein HK099_005619 [Clydaea vesicula]
MTLVSHIFIAEFDIDKGSNLTYQYPTQTNYDPAQLADLMLPDGAHQRQEDWTYFFLNRDVVNDAANFFNALLNAGVQENSNNLKYKELPLPLTKIQQKCLTENTHFEEHKPFLHVINLVRTKFISGARRGAEVKALAIASQYSWVHIFKPLLVLGLEKFFNQPSELILKELFESVNKMIMDNFPFLTNYEKLILRSSEDETIFEEKFLYSQNIVNKSNNLVLKSTEENLENSNNSNIYNTTQQKPVTQNNLNQKKYDRHFFETKVDFDSITIPIRIPCSVFSEEIGDFSIIKLISIFSSTSSAILPLPNNSNPIKYRNGLPYQWHPHLDNGPNTHPITLLLNALICQKNVLFLGYGKPSAEVANFVLAACAMASCGGSLLRGFINRCFPYVSLVGIELLLQINGYIAGVTNPVFEEQNSWWDVLCNINTGKITVSPKIKFPNSTDKSGSNFKSEKLLDGGEEHVFDKSIQNDVTSEFIYDLVTSVNSHMPEFYVREKIYDFVERFVDLTSTYELETFGKSDISTKKEVDNLENDSDDGNSIYTLEKLVGSGTFFSSKEVKMKELTFFRNWFEGWRETENYLLYVKDFQTKLLRKSIRGIDAKHLISRLKSSETISDIDTVTIFLAIQDSVTSSSEQQLTEFLSFLPQSQGGVNNCIALGLIHRRWEVRRATVRIFARLSAHYVGIKFLHHLNPFFKIVYEKLGAELLVSELETLNSFSSDAEKVVLNSKINNSGERLTKFSILQRQQHQQEKGNPLNFGSTFSVADSYWEEESSRKNSTNQRSSPSFLPQDQHQPGIFGGTSSSSLSSTSYESIRSSSPHLSNLQREPVRHSLTRKILPFTKSSSDSNLSRTLNNNANATSNFNSLQNLSMDYPPQKSNVNNNTIPASNPNDQNVNRYRTNLKSPLSQESIGKNYSLATSSFTQQSKYNETTMVNSNAKSSLQYGTFNYNSQSVQPHPIILKRSSSENIFPQLQQQEQNNSLQEQKSPLKSGKIFDVFRSKKNSTNNNSVSNSNSSIVDSQESPPKAAVTDSSAVVKKLIEQQQMKQQLLMNKLKEVRKTEEDNSESSFQGELLVPFGGKEPPVSNSLGLKREREKLTSIPILQLPPKKKKDTLNLTIAENVVISKGFQEQLKDDKKFEILLKDPVKLPVQFNFEQEWEEIDKLTKSFENDFSFTPRNSKLSNKKSSVIYSDTGHNRRPSVEIFEEEVWAEESDDEK